MIPLADENPLHRVPIITIGLIIACIWVFVVVQPAGQISPIESSEQAERRDLEFTVDYAAIPCEVVRNKPLTVPEFRAVFEAQSTDQCAERPVGEPAEPNKSIYGAIAYSMFLHGGWLHLIGNMLFLWIFGNNVEDRVGRLRFTLFYLVAGLIGTIGHVVIDPNSALPVIGASGAIAGVMGAYLILFPTTWVRAWIIIFIGSVPAFVFLIFGS